jgi:hypothetical protein
VREFAGFAAFNGLALALGWAVLFATALMPLRAAPLALATGAAGLTGLALMGLAALMAVIAGLGMDLAVFGPLVVVAIAVLAVVGRRRRAAAEDDEPGGARARWLLPLLVVAFVAIQALASHAVPVAWDASHIWTLKAFALSSSGQLDGQLFTGGDGFSIAHLDYPLGWPVLGGLLVRFTGHADQGWLIAELWIVLGAAVLTVPWLVRGGRWAALAFAPMILAMVAAPSAGLLRGDADVPMACFAAAGVAGLASALESKRRGYAVLAAIWLAMAANMKNEGLAFAAAGLVAAFAVAVAGRRRSQILTVAGAGVAVIALALPWKLWTSAHGPFTSDVAPLSDSLSLGYLSDHLPQLDLGAQTMLGRIIDPSAYWLVPALLALTGAAIAARRYAPTAWLYLTAFVVSVLAVLWVYWTSQLTDVAGHIERTTIRTITGPLFIAAAGLAHLLPRLLGDLRLDELAPPSEPREEPQLVTAAERGVAR